LKHLYDADCLAANSFPWNVDAIEALVSNREAIHLEVSGFGMEIHTLRGHMPFFFTFVTNRQIDAVTLMMSHPLTPKTFDFLGVLLLRHRPLLFG
jgi:hypothetical protein